MAEAILGFQAEYGRWPVSRVTLHTNGADFTFGTLGTGASFTIKDMSDLEANNAEVVRLLIADETSAGIDTSEAWKLMNPRRIEFLHAKRLGDNGRGGIGMDGVFRDPWGNPYIITLDLNGDGWCEGGGYRVRAKVLVWSGGPDGKANPKLGTGEGVNKDNILSAQ